MVKIGNGGVVINNIIHIFFISFIFNLFITFYTIYSFIETVFFRSTQGSKLKLKKF